MARYESAVLSELSRARFADHENNYDHELGAEPAPPASLLSESLATARTRVREAWRLSGEAAQALGRALEHHLTPKRYFRRHAAAAIDRGRYLYDRLADEKSRELLVKLVAFRVLGHRKVKLPRNTPEHMPTIADMSKYMTSDPPLPIKFMDHSLAVFDTKPLGYDMRVHATTTGLAYALRQKQYEYHNGDVHCKAEAGDVVIDAGGCWGETTMYFAHEAGPTGLCVAYEFIPSNVEVIKRNLALNPHLADRIRVVQHPLWNTTGKELYFVDWGPGSRVSDDPKWRQSAQGKATTITIDETLKLLGLNRLNFIKMDIEGSELAALKGGEASIRKYRPKLAISLYHRPEDFTDIPRYIDSLNLGYKFYLEHHTLYQNETVLFAVPQPPPLDVAYTLHVQGKLAAAEARYRDIIDTDGASLDAMAARNNLLALYRGEDRPADAEGIIRDALQVTPDDAKWRFRLATALLRDGRYAEGWDAFEARKELGRARATVSGLPFPEWTGQPVKSLVVWSEDSAADVVQFSRYLPLLRARGISVTVVCPPRFATLLAPLADAVTPLTGSFAVSFHDAWVMIGSLPRFFGTTLETIPPSAMTPSAGGSGVGVSMAGLDTLPEPERARIVARGRELLAEPGAMDLDAACQGADWLAIAHTLSGLEKVVCTSTAVAHLAASLNKPTTVLLPAGETDWRWLQGRSDSPWYPSMTLARLT
jgi:FkbM family methyltransferase